MPQSEEEDMIVSDMMVGPSYCETLGLPVLLGREIGLQDTESSPKVAVVNQAFAEYFFHGENPIGRRFGFGDDPKDSAGIEIVGVIGDAKYEDAEGEASSHRVPANTPGKRSTRRILKFERRVIRCRWRHRYDRRSLKWMTSCPSSE